MSTQRNHQSPKTDLKRPSMEKPELWSLFRFRPAMRPWKKHPISLSHLPLYIEGRNCTKQSQKRLLLLMFCDSVIAVGWNLNKAALSQIPTIGSEWGAKRSSLKIRFPRMSGLSASTKGRRLFFLLYNMHQSIEFAARACIVRGKNKYTSSFYNPLQWSQEAPLARSQWRPKRAYSTRSIL